MDYKNCLAFLVCHSAKRKSIDFAKFDVRYTLEPLEFTVPSGSFSPPRKKHRLSSSRRDGDNRAPPTPLKGSPTAGLTRAPRPSLLVLMHRFSSGGGSPTSRRIKKKGHKIFKGSQKVSKNFLGKGETDVKANIRQVFCRMLRKASCFVVAWTTGLRRHP